MEFKIEKYFTYIQKETNNLMEVILNISEKIDKDIPDIYYYLKNVSNDEIITDDFVNITNMIVNIFGGLYNMENISYYDKIKLQEYYDNLVFLMRKIKLEEIVFCD